MNDIQSLSHSKWRCKYHIVFAPKYRRQVIYGDIKADVGKILRELSETYTYAGIYSTALKRIFVYGLSKKQKQPYDI